MFCVKKFYSCENKCSSRSPFAQTKNRIMVYNENVSSENTLAILLLSAVCLHEKSFNGYTKFSCYSQSLKS